MGICETCEYFCTSKCKTKFLYNDLKCTKDFNSNLKYSTVSEDVNLRLVGNNSEVDENTIYSTSWGESYD